MSLSSKLKGKQTRLSNTQQPRLHDLADHLADHHLTYQALAHR